MSSSCIASTQLGSCRASENFLGVGLAEIDVSILLTSASTLIISSKLVDNPRSLASLEVSEESFKQAVGTSELTVGIGDSTVSVSIYSAKGLNVEAVGLGFPLPSVT
nr:hypothetical protein [Tanacetum cinerariifolium]